MPAGKYFVKKWDWNNSKYVNHEKTDITYTPLQKEAQRTFSNLNTQTETWDLSSQLNYVYPATGFMLYEIFSIRNSDNTDWVYQLMRGYNYDENGNQAENFFLPTAQHIATGLVHSATPTRTTT